MRDAMINGDVRPGTGSVSPEALTQIARGAAAARPAISEDLANSFRAAGLPPAGPGRTRGAAARPQNPGQRNTGKEGHTR